MNFSGFLENVLVLYFKWLKPAAGLVCNYLKLSRDLFANYFSLSLLSTVAMALAPCRHFLDAHAALPLPPGSQGRTTPPRSLTCSPFFQFSVSSLSLSLGIGHRHCRHWVEHAALV